MLVSRATKFPDGKNTKFVVQKWVRPTKNCVYTEKLKLNDQTTYPC